MFILKPGKNIKFFFGKEDVNFINPQNGKILVESPYTPDDIEFLNKLKEVSSSFYPSKNKQEIIDIINELIQTNNSLELYKILQDRSISSTTPQKIIGDSPTKMKKQCNIRTEKDKIKHLIQFALNACGIEHEQSIPFITGFSPTIWGITKTLLKAYNSCTITPRSDENDIHLFIPVARDRYIYLVNILKDYKIKFANMDLGRNKNSLIIERVRLNLYPENTQAPQNWELEQIIIIDPRIENILPLTSPITIKPCGNVRTPKNLCMFDEIYKFLFNIHSAIPKNMQLNYEKIFSAIVTAKYNATEEIKKKHKHTKQFLNRLKFTMMFCTKTNKTTKTIAEYLKKHTTSKNKAKIYASLNNLSINFFINKIKEKAANDKNKKIPDEIWKKFSLFCNSFGHITACDKEQLNEKTKFEVKLDSTLNCLAKNKTISQELHFSLCVLLIKVKHGWNQSYYHELHYFIRNHFKICNSDFRHGLYKMLHTSEMIFFLLCAGHPKEALKYNNNGDWLEGEAIRAIRENHFPLGSKISNDTISIIKGFMKYAGTKKMWGWKLHTEYTKKPNLLKELRTFIKIYNEDKSKLPLLTNKVAHTLFSNSPPNSELPIENRGKALGSLMKAIQKLMPTELSEYKDFNKIDCLLCNIKDTVPHDDFPNTIFAFFLERLYIFSNAYHQAFLFSLCNELKKNPNQQPQILNTFKDNIIYIIDNKIITRTDENQILFIFYNSCKPSQKISWDSLFLNYKKMVSQKENIIATTIIPINALIEKTKPYTGLNPNDPIQLLQTICKNKLFSPIKQEIPYKTCISNYPQLLNMLFKLAIKDPIINITSKDKSVKTAMIHGNVIIIGDIHGDFNSLVVIIKQLQDFLDNGNKVVFLGDLIDMRDTDKKDESIAVVLLVLRLHTQYRNQVIILRGNHEYERVYYKGGFGYGSEWFIRLSNSKEIIQNLNSIFNQFSITAFHLSKKGITSMSHAAPYYIPKSFIELATGGFLCKPHNSDNNGTWNDIDANENSYEGEDSKRNDKENPLPKEMRIKLVGKKTKAALQKMNIIRHILGHLHVNKSFYDFFYSISSGNFQEKTNTQMVGFLRDNGDFYYIHDINKISEGINAISFKS